jgi:hypothetical protein
MTKTYTDPSGKPNPKAPGRCQTFSAPSNEPKTVAEAVAAGWSRAQIMGRIAASNTGKHLPRGSAK